MDDIPCIMEPLYSTVSLCYSTVPAGMAGLPPPAMPAMPGDKPPKKKGAKIMPGGELREGFIPLAEPLSLNAEELK